MTNWTRPPCGRVRITHINIFATIRYIFGAACLIFLFLTAFLSANPRFILEGNLSYSSLATKDTPRTIVSTQTQAENGRGKYRIDLMPVEDAQSHHDNDDDLSFRVSAKATIRPESADQNTPAPAPKSADFYPQNESLQTFTPVSEDYKLNIEDPSQTNRSSNAVGVQYAESNQMWKAVEDPEIVAMFSHSNSNLPPHENLVTIKNARMCVLFVLLTIAPFILFNVVKYRNRKIG